MSENETKPSQPVTQTKTRYVPSEQGGEELATLTRVPQEDMQRLKQRLQNAQQERSQCLARAEELEDVLAAGPARAKRIAADADAKLAAKLAELDIRCPLADVRIECPDPKRPNDLVVTYAEPAEPKKE